MKSKSLILIVLGMVIFLQGCETFKGAAIGFKKDVENTWNGASKADVWIKDTLW